MTQPPEESLSAAEIGILLDQLSTPAFIMGRDHRIVADNAAFRSNFSDGLPSRGRTCHETIHRIGAPCHTRGVACPARHCLKSGVTHRALHVHPSPGGEVWQRVTAFAIPNEPDLPRWSLAVIQPPAAFTTESDDSWPVAKSRPMRQVMSLLKKVAQVDAPVLLLGEPGTGRRLLARTIHRLGPRRLHPFVPVDCPSICGLHMWDESDSFESGPASLALSWTSALAVAVGDGTLFLSEVGDLTPNCQAILRALIDRRAAGVDVLGDDCLCRFRLISAASSDLAERLESGWLRKDFYYRISNFIIRVPSLLEQVEDLPGSQPN